MLQPTGQSNNVILPKPHLIEEKDHPNPVDMSLFSTKFNDTEVQKIEFQKLKALPPLEIACKLGDVEDPCDEFTGLILNTLAKFFIDGTLDEREQATRLLKKYVENHHFQPSTKQAIQSICKTYLVYRGSSLK